MLRWSVRGSGGLGVSFLLGVLVAGPGAAAARVATLNVDLAPKIEASFSRPERFAVDVAHVADTASAGEWERSAGTSTWRYSVRIPTAVSMSFHAGTWRLPTGASLTVSDSSGARVVYARDAGAASGLWSRISRGDSLHFELRVATRDEAEVGFAISSLQAGYRVLGGGAPDHPHFRKLQRSRALAAGIATCTQNWTCHATPANEMNGDATAAIVIGGVALCSATLVNNLRNDGTPYLLSARHCQDFPYSGVVVYWDAVAACGAPLGTVYDTQTTAYLHTTNTVFEQQDVWLIELTGPINGNRVYFAGWDATGSTFVGGYSPHHALGRGRQYAEWYGQAALQTLTGSTLGIGYDSTYWGVVNSVGRVGSGASGGGLFNPEHRLVGVASLAYLDDDGEGMCPATPTPVPGPETSTALYNALSAVWDTNDDTTSYTNPVTLRSLLDPDDTGGRVANGFEMLQGVWINASPSYASTGTAVTLTWNGGSATTCTASGGVAGDGWSGPRAANGSAGVIQYGAGPTTYTVRCTDGARFAVRSVQVTWQESTPQVFIGIQDTSYFLGDAARIYWRSNVQPCSATGGIAGDGWPGVRTPNGSHHLTLSQVGHYTWTITCGSGSAQATASVQAGVSEPFATLEALSNNMRVGNEITLLQTAGGTSCTRTGGVPGDGWAGSDTSYPVRVSSANPGTFRYTLTCNGGPTPAIAQVDLTWTNDPPTATLTASKPTAEVVPDGPIQDITGPTPFLIEFSWVSNVAPCQLSYDGPGGEDGVVNPAMDAAAVDSRNSRQTVPGTYEYRVTCTNGGHTSTATTTVNFLPPAARVTLSRSDVIAANEPVQITWRATTSPCVASGGAPGDNWAGPVAMTGSANVTLTSPGDYDYTVTCGTAPNVVSDTLRLKLDDLHVEFEPHAAQAYVQRGTVLRWAGNVGPCTLTGSWSGSFGANGGSVVLSGTTGTRTYGVRCGTTSIVEATTQVTYLPLPSVDITADVQHAFVNQPITLSWTSANAQSCQVQGTGMPDWSGPLPTSGSRVMTRSTPGTVGFYISCDDASDAVVVEWRSVITSPPRAQSPTVTLNIDHTTRLVGEPVTITWTTTRAAACRAGVGVSGDGWNGALPVSGTRSYIVSLPGTYTWEIICEGAPPAAIARVSTTYSSATPPPPPPPPPDPPPPPSSSSSSGGGASSTGGKGGGGNVDPVLLGLLGASLWMLRRRELRARSHVHAR